MNVNEMVNKRVLRSFLSRLREYVPILGYHQVCDIPLNHRLKPFAVSPVDFEQQMTLLSVRGYHSLSLDEFVAARQQGSIPAGKYFVLTFDDGYRDNYLTAFPILQKFGFKATVFLVSDWLLQGHDGREVPTLVLRLEDIAEMSRGGIAFGAHTCNHRSLIALSPEEAQLEIRGSKEVLENYLNQPIRFFSYPYGHSNPHIRSTVRASGFAGACSNHRSSDDLFNLRRTMVHRDDSLLDFRLKVWGWDVWLLQVLKWLERKSSFA